MRTLRAVHQRDPRGHRHGAQAVFGRVAAGLVVLTASLGTVPAAGAAGVSALARLTPPGSIGPTVALSHDGSTAFAAGEDHGVSVVWVFGLTPFGFSQVQELRAPSAGPYAAIGRTGFGASLAVSTDGLTALVGAPLDADKQGAVWGFTRSGGTWTASVKLTPPLTGPNAETSRPGFGTSVAVSANGAEAAIGGPNEGGYRGAVWIAKGSGAGWRIEHKLTVRKPRGVNPFFGSSLALSDSGRELLVGAYGESSAWSFAAPRWRTPQRIAPPAHGRDRAVGRSLFGFAVGLSASGNRALVSGPADHPGGGNGFGRGAAWIFDRTARGWTDRAKLAPGGGHDAIVFGYAAALSADGRTALAGAPDAGATGMTFAFSGPGWTRQTITPPATGPLAALGSEQYFGSGTALSANGTRALIADDALSPGNAWIFSR